MLAQRGRGLQFGLLAPATPIYGTPKQITGRRRPCEAFPDIRRRAAMPDRYGFPSGHTVHAIGFSAVLLGLHHPSDVLARAPTGGTVAWTNPRLSV